MKRCAAIIPDLATQLLAIGYCAGKQREILALAVRGRVKPQVIDEIARRIEALEAAAATLAAAAGAQELAA